MTDGCAGGCSSLRAAGAGAALRLDPDADAVTVTAAVITAAVAVAAVLDGETRGGDGGEDCDRRPAEVRLARPWLSSARRWVRFKPVGTAAAATGADTAGRGITGRAATGPGNA